ncbi:MAG: hypothetical protein IJZ20_08405, partial [Clostridia bacterium]|nr:hypothetical protein [Clostridia bacterium]
MKNSRTVLFLIIFAVCIFCFASCGRNNAGGSTPNGTGTGAGSVSGNMSNDTVNSNRGNADGGTADRNRSGDIIDGAAGDIIDGAGRMAEDVTDGITNGINDMTHGNGNTNNA